MQKYYELNTDEKKLLADFEQGKLTGVRGGKKESERYRGYAKASLNKTRNINIRLPERDIQKLKTKAAQIRTPLSDACFIGAPLRYG